jgi:hypothetical protein
VHIVQAQVQHFGWLVKILRYFFISVFAYAYARYFFNGVIPSFEYQLRIGKEFQGAPEFG